METVVGTDITIQFWIGLALTITVLVLWVRALK
jgi:hypothetical protein